MNRIVVLGTVAQLTRDDVPCGVVIDSSYMTFCLDHITVLKRSD